MYRQVACALLQQYMVLDVDCETFKAVLYSINP